MPPRDKPHLIIPRPPRTLPFKSPLSGGDRPYTSTRSRADHAKHARFLQSELKTAKGLGERAFNDAGYRIEGGRQGFYFEFESAPGQRLDLAELEVPGRGIEIVAVSERPAEVGAEEGVVQHAVLFTPRAAYAAFAKRLDKYLAAANKASGTITNEALFDPVARIGLSTLRGLWTEHQAAFPDECEAVWWEVWLLRRDPGTWGRFQEFVQRAELKLADRHIGLGEYQVALVFGFAAQLASSLSVLGDIAEVRRPHTPTSFFVETDDDVLWGRELVERVEAPGAGAPAVCVLDTGVVWEHPLLRPALDPADAHSCFVQFGPADCKGHGTETAGIALYGDLQGALASLTPVVLSHRLESVKVLPDRGAPPQTSTE